MRKKLCIIIAGLIIMGAAAGCAGKKDNNKNSSSQASSASSTESKESTAESKTESKTESPQASTENSEKASTDQSSENESPFIDITYTSFDLEGLQKGTSAKLPASYIITSKSELEDFLTKNESEYILSRAMLSVANGAESNQNFLTYSSANYNDEMFKSSDLMLVMAAFNKSEEIDLGDISIDGNNLKIELWGAEPGSDSEQQFVMYSIPYKKGMANGKEISFRYTGEITAEGEEEGGEEEIVADGEEGEEIVIEGEEGTENGEKSEEEMIIVSEEPAENA